MFLFSRYLVIIYISARKSRVHVQLVTWTKQSQPYKCKYRVSLKPTKQNSACSGPHRLTEFYLHGFRTILQHHSIQLRRLGPIIPQNIKENLSTKIVHISVTFLNKSKNSSFLFEPCSHIELNTQNPNLIFKITIYYTKYTKQSKILSNIWRNLWNIVNIR